jgi:hypothetical protein
LYNDQRAGGLFLEFPGEATMSLWYFGRTLAGRPRLSALTVHFTEFVFFLLVLLMAVFVFVSRLF